MATIARAMVASREVDDKLELRTLHASFLDRPSSGSLVIDTDVARVGGVTAHVEAKASGHGQDETAARVWGLFTLARPGVGRPYLDADPPDVPGPRDLPPDPFGNAVRPMAPPLFDHLEFRAAIGVLPWVATWTADQPARYARWNRYLVPPVDEQGRLDPLALLTIADLPATALWVRSRPGDPLLGAVSLEMTVNFLDHPTSEWVLADFRARWFDQGYVFTEADLWCDHGLVAVANQVMFVREVEVPPAPPS